MSYCLITPVSLVECEQKYTTMLHDFILKMDHDYMAV